MSFRIKTQNENPFTSAMLAAKGWFFTGVVTGLLAVFGLFKLVTWEGRNSPPPSNPPAVANPPTQAGPGLPEGPKTAPLRFTLNQNPLFQGLGILPLP